MKDALSPTQVIEQPPVRAGLTAVQQENLMILRQQDQTRYIEVALRISITLLAAVALWQYTGQIGIFLWLAAHTVLNATYLTWLSRIPMHQPHSVSLRTYRIAFAICMTLITAFGVVPVYLVWLNDPVLTLTALAGLAGLGLQNLIVHSRIRAMAIFSPVMLAALLGSCGAIYMTHTDSMAGQLLILTCFTSICGYYAFCQYRMFNGHQQIRAAEARAAEAQRMQAIGQMTRGIARDFNNLITGIQGNLELSKHLSDGADREKTLEQARDATERAALLTSRLVAYARQTPLRPDNHDMADLMPRIASTLRQELPEGHKLTLAPTGKMPPLQVDGAQLTRALSALLANAVAATPDGGTITLRNRLVAFSNPVTYFGRTGLGPGTYCAISMIDNGTGIAPELLDRVTEPFFTTSPSPRHSGLGLPMSLGFAEQSGGAMGITSTPGRTEVTLFLPCPDPVTRPS